MINRCLLAFLFLMSCYVAIAQEDQNPGNTFPKIIPPSPELSSLANIGTITAQNQTGAASVQIPLYDLRVGSVSMPISLTYSTNGIKVNDVPSRVGLGWNLIAGGSITRIIHDEDDFYSGTHYLPRPSSFSPEIGGPTLRTYLVEALEPANFGDTEKDEYSFNVNGMSGKFFLDDNGIAQCENGSDIKIEKLGDAFTLTTGEGVKYFFGETVFEKTIDVKINGLNRPNYIATTGWFLWKISTPEGDNILFTYSSLDVKYYEGHSQTAILPLHTYVPSFEPGSCHTCNNDVSYINPIANNWIEYDTKYLTGIDCSNGVSLAFSYESRGDGSNDNRLVSLNVDFGIENILHRALKRYKFQYDTYHIENDNQQRYYLKNLSSYPCIGPEVNPIVHSFEYNSPSGLPSEKSLAQDYFGYYNGANNGDQNFWPKPLGYDNYTNGFLGANREPNFDKAKKGSLSKVVYPTGGYKEFVYEPHTLVQTKADFSYAYSFLSCVGVGYSSPNITTLPFSIGATSHSLKISYVIHSNPSGPVLGQPNYWEPGETKIIATLRIMNATNTQQLYVRTFTTQTMNAAPEEINLPFNTNFLLVLEVDGSRYQGDVELKYNKVETNTAYNANACGLRVKQINSFDPVSNKTTSQYYTYASLSSIANASGKSIVGDNSYQPEPVDVVLSSGSGTLTASNATLYPYGHICIYELIPGVPTGVVVPEICSDFIQVSSSSIAGSYSFGGSPIGYTFIIESDDPNFIHGGTEHLYSTDYVPINVSPLLNTPIESNLGFGNNLNGKELRTRVFKAAPDKFVLLKQEENIYNRDNRTNQTFLNYTVRQRFAEPLGAPIPTTTMNYTGQLSMFDVGEYALIAGWVHLDTKIATTFDEDGNNPLVQRTDYVYDDVDHKQPTLVTTTNSKGEVVEKRLKYPSDYTNTAPYTDMLTAHIITPVVEENTILHGDLIKGVNTDYRYLPESQLFKPSQVHITKGSNPPEIGLQYNAYDTYGNPTDLLTQAGINRVYLWNYKHTFPVAEVNKAALSDVAYTSFEGDDPGIDPDIPGKWAFDQTKVTANGITGLNCYSGVLRRVGLNPDKKYTVTLWAKAEALVNGGQGILITTKGDWKLLKWELQNIENVEITGEYVDEVRLIPRDATITTYTYIPYVGLSSICDDNNNISYFEYDGFNRLLLIRDIDKNIVKQYDYRYGSPIEPCADVTARWAETGITRCVQAGPNNNYTGEKQIEQQDVNNCSATYLQTRWVNATAGPTECLPVPNCEGERYKVIGGVCEEARKALQDTQLLEPGQWRCTYEWVWSDNSHSGVFYEYNNIGCSDILIVE